MQVPREFASELVKHYLAVEVQSAQLTFLFAVVCRRPSVGVAGIWGLVVRAERGLVRRAKAMGHGGRLELLPR